MTPLTKGKRMLIPTMANTFEMEMVEGEVKRERVREGGWEGGVLCGAEGPEAGPEAGVWAIAFD